MLRTKASASGISPFIPRVCFHTLLPVVIVLILLPVLSIARDEPERVGKSELHKHSFAVGELRITITRFWPGSLLSRGYVAVKAENTSSSAVVYNPQRLSFISNNNRQVNTRGRRQTGGLGRDDSGLDIAQPREIAPNAYIKEFYELDGRVRLPARLFYEAKVLALITN
ncbi:MAG TPA: hypothetical protein VFB82_15945 [Blastocatellia bacterium]|jgi:hypothetical protein|nr:hypothetical protein [Blastocatellia bacterium]